MPTRNARRHARPARGPLPVFTPGPSFHAEHQRHAQLIETLAARGLVLGELTELIDLRQRTGRAWGAGTGR